MEWMDRNPDFEEKEQNGLQVLWITPLRALAKDAVKSMQEACAELGLKWRVEMRTGDTPQSLRKRQEKKMPECLVTTPESLHVLIAQKNHARHFRKIQVLVVDEWHDLLGTKRGIQLELASAHLKRLSSTFKVWGISATIGNMEEALHCLLGSDHQGEKSCIVRADLDKKIEMVSVLPEEIETFPWSGHLGVHMVNEVIPIIDQSTTTLLFTNTRNQAEVWYHALLNQRPDWAGIMALHHGSLSSEVRAWVEEALHDERMKVVVCTASLDLGVDFRPVETVIQIGGPKGVARFLQRAGRSGHQPGATSRIYFVPTHSLELIEAAALRKAIGQKAVEQRKPLILAYDTLIQYLLTLAVGDGFIPKEVWEEAKSSFCYSYLDEDAWDKMLTFITSGGYALHAYEEFKKVEIEEGVYKVLDRKIARRHRLSMGTIVASMQLKVKLMRGGTLGTVEESFISTLEPGDTFWFSGRALELVRVRGNEVQVRKSKKTKGKIPSWSGGRMPMSSQMSDLLRQELHDYQHTSNHSVEIEHLRPLLELQAKRSLVPDNDHFLIERLQSSEGHHLFIYPFEGRLIHEMFGALFAYRISQMQPISFSIAMNDYGLELLSDQEIPLEMAIEKGLFSTKNLLPDLERSINETLLAQKKFHEIAHISGLMFRGYPGQNVRNKHLHATSSLLFKVFKEHEPDHLLLRQAFSEVIDYQIDEVRMRESLERIQAQKIRIIDLERATPFSFPIMVDRLREKLSSEKLKDRVEKMQLVLKR
jgi:ATP-dependent Lhr-like helicase